MDPNPPRKKKRGRIWRFLKKLFGNPPELVAAWDALEALRREATDQRAKLDARVSELEKELEQTREERLRWIAKESTTRKDLQDCQERSKELLEQVVRLTHQERLTKQTLLDQQFKTATTPLERNRFEMELTEARTRVKDAEERAKRAEEKAARIPQLEKQVGRLKQVESELGWAKEQAEAHLRALGATIEKVRELETRVPGRELRKKVASARRGSYHKPAIRPASRSQRAFFHTP